MAFLRGSQINPALGRTDFTPFLQGSLAGSQMAAQGAGAMGQGLAGLMSGVGQGIDAYKKNKEETKKLEGFLKAADKMSAGFEPIMDKIDPRIGQSIQQMRQMIGDPNLSVRERASAAQAFLQQAPVLLNSGIQLMDKQNEAAAINQRAVAAAAEMAAKQAAEGRKRQVELATAQFITGGGQGAPQGFAPDVALMAQAQGRKQLAEIRKDEAALNVNGYATAEEALKAAQALRLPAGQEPSFRQGAGGRYFPEAVVRPPEQVEDPEKKARVGMMTKQFEGDILAGDVARKTMPQVGRLLKLLGEGGLETGKLAEFKANAAAWAKAIGAEVDDAKLADVQEATAYFPQFIFEKIQQTKGAITEKENALFQEMGPMIGRTNEANRRLLEMTQARLRLDADIAKVAAEASRGSITFEAAAKKRDELVAKYDEKLPEPSTLKASPDKTDGFSPDVFKFIKAGKK